MESSDSGLIINSCPIFSSSVMAASSCSGFCTVDSSSGLGSSGIGVGVGVGSGVGSFPPVGWHPAQPSTNRKTARNVQMMRFILFCLLMIQHKGLPAKRTEHFYI